MIGRVRLIAFLACCLAGWVALILLFPKFDAVNVRWKTQATRTQVIDAARSLAMRYSVDTAGWDFYVTAQSNRGRALARLERPSSPVLQMFTSMEFVVAASRPGTPAHLQAVLSSDLRPISFRVFAPRRGMGAGKDGRGSRPDRPRPDGPRPDRERPDGPRPDGPGPRAQAPAVDFASQLALFAGSNAPRYRQTAFAIPTPDGLLSAWEWGEADGPGLVARLQVFVRRGGVTRAEHELQIAAPLIASRLAQHELPQSFANPTRSLFIFFTISVACWYFFRSMATSFVPLRFAMAILPIVAIPLLADFLVGPDRDRTVITAYRTNSTTMAGVTSSALGLALVFGALILIVASGRSILAVAERPLWLSAQRIYLRQLLSRPLGLDILAGLAAGPAIAATPFLVLAASGRTDLVIRSFATPAFLSAAHPWASSLGESGPWVAIAAFGLIRPWTQRFAGMRPLWSAILTLYGILSIVLFLDPLPGSRPLALAASALMYFSLWLTYRQLGLLAVWIAGFSAAAAAMALALLYNGMGAQAWSAAAPALLIALGGLALSLFGRGEDRHEVLESFEIQPRERIVNERARLDAEFSVATAAQRRLLPAKPPIVPGFSLAGSCVPAREVGGDLFDYMALPDGQLGLCVADVSGKGVPAALYMTLTKGMLASAQPKHLPLPVLASRLNKHLLATGQRKTFVTMSIAVLEPSLGRLRHVRAGHNPPLLYRAATKSWELLKPRGLGLGLASTATFERILHEQDVDLLPGDIVVLYSDGLTEMMDPDNELFGEERLAQAVTANAHRSAQTIHDAVIAAAREFQSGAEQHDDLTLLVLKTELSLT